MPRFDLIDAYTSAYVPILTKPKRRLKRRTNGRTMRCVSIAAVVLASAVLFGL
jgi:hypothetical protein